MTNSERTSPEPVLTSDPIVPDAKDWTWVLEQPCADCGLDAGAVVREDVAGMVRANAAGWTAVLGGDLETLRRRPRPEIWSDLEYACHVRDVFRLFRVRLDLTLDQDDPLFANWDQDATAVAERYGEQRPAVVAVELAEAAEALAAAFEGVAGARWARTGNRSDGARFTVESFARYLIHDPVHHLYDVTGERV
ncbi:DinB family protein [Kitasatospora purpeofusca]|uniref:DinB family protein n=1 Tax=Kitasatospora purpeofusca TaxID=67352 RepID=UPI002255E9EF|nr:DinB family protein [Kitasatospora purpeofusca]MCX4753002.1 DinB family protein [Kitasatospora purpeofusca]WSR32538.1 DinB family protein [Kitasatospora purpeofusca]